MKLKELFTSIRSATFELPEGGLYHTKSPISWS